MTPATRGEVDELLEPAGSWPERTMLATTVSEGMPRQPSCAATPQIVRTTVQHTNPNRTGAEH